MQNPNNARNADLGVILTTMAHEIDHDMTQAQQLKVMEVFGAMIDTVLSDHAEA